MVSSGSDFMPAARQADAALASFGLSMLAMYADSRLVPNPAATDLAALIFIPLALTFLWSLLALASLAPHAYAAAKVAVSTAKHRLAILPAPPLTRTPSTT